MDLVVLAPSFSATTFEWILAGGGRAVTVVCKLTFPLEPGTDAPLSPSQEPIAVADQFSGAGPEASLTIATDLVPYKAAADVVVTGFAYAPPGQRATTVSARLVVGNEIDKTLEVSGPRSSLPDGPMQDPEPFERVALRWENAAGGPDTTNPAGISAPTPPASTGFAAAPQIVSPAARLEPAGFGPIAPAWPTRSKCLCGAPALGEDWVKQPLPWTIDPAFFNVAPPDQRLKMLLPNESILLFGLLRDREKFGMRLPGVQPRAFAQMGRGAKDIPLLADTLWIDTDRALVTVTWRGQAPIGSTARRIVVALQPRDVVMVWADLEPQVPKERPLVVTGSVPVAPPARQIPPAPPAPPMAPMAAPLPPPGESSGAGAPVLVSAPLPTFIGRRSPEEEASTPQPEAAPAAPEAPPPRRAGDPLDLLWFDPAIVPKLRANRAWRKLVDALELVASDDGAAGDGEDRREIFQVLANAQAEEIQALAGTLASAISPDGKLDPPLAVTAGDLTLPFDAAELLKVTISASKPIAPTDDAFSKVVATVVSMADAAAFSDAVAHGLTWRLREAFQKVKHTLGPRYLESTAERALLEGRRYQKRDVFGAPHVRALVTPASGEPVPAYLPVAVASRLPLYPRFPARLVAEVHAQVDYEETHPCALRVLAIARAVPRPSGKS
jgi:hypothetical protein